MQEKTELSSFIFIFDLYLYVICHFGKRGEVSVGQKNRFNNLTVFSGMSYVEYKFFTGIFKPARIL